MRYALNIDRKVKVWVNEEIDFEFDGTEADVQELLQKHGGDLNAIPEFGDLTYSSYEYIIETEEHLTPEENGGMETYEIKDLEVDGGMETYEIKDLEVDEELGMGLIECLNIRLLKLLCALCHVVTGIIGLLTLGIYIPSLPLWASTLLARYRYIVRQRQIND